MIPSILEVPDFEIVPIKGFGKCTLISCDKLPQSYRSYNWLKKNYQMLSSMKEFPDLTREQLGDIVCSLIIFFGSEARNRGDAQILLSGSHMWSGLLSKKTYQQVSKECVTLLTLWTSNPEGGVIEYWPQAITEEYPVNDLFDEEMTIPLYVLFLGRTI